MVGLRHQRSRTFSWPCALLAASPALVSACATPPANTEASTLTQPCSSVLVEVTNRRSESLTIYWQRSGTDPSVVLDEVLGLSTTRLGPLPALSPSDRPSFSAYYDTPRGRRFVASPQVVYALVCG
jgi:hypothetical protein